MSTQLVGGGTSTVDALAVVGALTVGGNPLDVAFQQLVNNTGASSDITLAIGQQAYVDVSAATTAALKIATGDNQEYEIKLNMVGNTGSTGNTGLQPNNNSGLTNLFLYGLSTIDSYATGYTSSFMLGSYSDIRAVTAKVSTKTASKTVLYHSHGISSGSVYSSVGGSSWVAVASAIASDTTTAWTSLGTVIFPVAATGRSYIRRLA